MLTCSIEIKPLHMEFEVKRRTRGKITTGAAGSVIEVIPAEGRTFGDADDTPCAVCFDGKQYPAFSDFSDDSFLEIYDEASI